MKKGIFILLTFLICVCGIKMEPVKAADLVGGYEDGFYEGAGNTAIGGYIVIGGYLDVDIQYCDMNGYEIMSYHGQALEGNRISLASENEINSYRNDDRGGRIKRFLLEPISDSRWYCYPGDQVQVVSEERWQYEKNSYSGRMIYIPGNRIIRLYVQYEEDYYQEQGCKVSFDTDGGNEISPIYVSPFRPYGQLPTPTKKGYRFIGWMYNGRIVDSNTVVQTTANHKLVARWEPMVYYLDLDTNGGETPIYHMKIQYGFPYGYREGSLPIPYRKGYDFLDWTFNGKVITSKTIVETDKDHTLIANWKACSYRVSFDSQGGSVCNPQEAIYDGTYGSLPKPTKTGYDFDGWLYGSSVITSSSKVNVASNHMLIAHWTPKKYIISFDSAGGSPVGNVQVVYDGTYGTLPIPTKTGYTFKGWKYGSTSITSTTRMTVAENHNLVATWEANSYELVLQLNGGTCENTTVKVTYDGKYGEMPVCEKDRYVFMYWSFDEEGEEKMDASQIVQITENTNIYAQYRKNILKLTLDPQNGEEISFKDVTYGDRYDLPFCKKTGYNFEGWYDKKTGGNKYITGLRVNIKDDATFYGQWKPVKCEVVFDYCDGTTPSLTCKGTYDAVYPTIPKPTRSGYIFKGWKIVKTNEMVGPNTKIKIAQKHYLAAQWEKGTEKKAGTTANNKDENGDISTIVQAGKIQISCKKVKKAKGYQFVLSTNKKCKKPKKGYYKKVTTKKNKVTFKKVQQNKKYYFKYRSYTQKGKKKKWSKWSKVKVITVK